MLVSQLLLAVVVYLLSELSCLFSVVCFGTPLLLHIFPAVLFVPSGGWVQGIVVISCVTLARDDRTTSRETNRVFVRTTAVLSVLWEPSLGSY